MAKRPARPNCRGTTRAGNPCKQHAAAGSAYCSSHGGGRRKVGRPSKLNEHVTRALIHNVSTGATLELAADAAGIHISTLHNWRTQGDADLDAGKDTQYSRLVDALSRARADGELALVSLIRSHGLTDWRAAAWLLERRAPKRWGRDGAADPSTLPDLAPRTVTPDEPARERILALLGDAMREPAPPPTPGAT
jgi:hypothetical protein